MKSYIRSLSCAVLIGAAIPLPAQAQKQAVTQLAPVIVEQPRAAIGPEKSFNPMVWVEVKNFQDETLGRISDLGISLTNGRIVEVLVTSDDSTGVDNKTIAVPPAALISDGINRVYRINMSSAQFAMAPAVDVGDWNEARRSVRVAAAYRFFGQEIFFLEDGKTASTTANRPLVPLGYVQLSSHLLDMPIRSHADVELGKVWSMILDIPEGRILSVIVISQGGFKVRNVVPAMALSFNAERDGLLLDDSPMELENEPRYIFTAAAYGQDAYSHQERYTGPHTSETLAQGSSYRDVDQTVRINREIRTTGIDCQKLEVGTLNDRVTLRGVVASPDDKRLIGAAAIRCSRVELVDNQISIRSPAKQS